MYTSEYFCHHHQVEATDCGCQRNICSKHRVALTSDGVNMVCLYCDWPEPEESDRQ